MNNSFYQKIKKHSKLISFHTPGHNGKLPKGLLKTDTTELFYSDNLLDPQGDIKELENFIAHVYNSDSAFISTNGATLSIMTAIYCLKDEGGFLIVGDAHSSVYNALRIFHCNAYHISDINKGEDIPQDVKTVIITSPDYFGVCKDIKSYKELLKDKFIILDMSHGSHFVFSNKSLFEPCKLCDLAVCSLHKTLPIATGGAVLLSYNKALSQKCFQTRKLLHSTSPSYMTLSTISRAFEIFNKKGKKLYQRIEKKIKWFKEKSDKIGISCMPNDDYTRLVITSKFEGEELERALISEGIVAEMSFLDRVVLIVTPYNYKHLKRVFQKLKGIMRKDIQLFHPKEYIKDDNKAVKLEFAKEYEVVAVEKAQGRKAYRGIGLYPPGTPFIKAGQTLSGEKLEFIRKHKDKCFGLENEGIAVILYKDGGKR